MWYPGRANFEGLREAAEGTGDPRLAGLAEYWRLKEKGLRAPARAAVRDWVSQAAAWHFSERREIVDQLLTMSLERPAVHQLIPHEVLREIVVPTLEEWRGREPGSARPLRWLGMVSLDEETVRSAVERDPADLVARNLLVRMLLDQLRHATHHLPEYFIGQVAEAERLTGEVRQLAAELDPAAREDALRSLEEVAALIDDWQSFTAEGGADFEQWCRERGREYEWISTFYYDP